VPVEQRGHGQFVTERDLQCVAALEAKSGVWRWALKRPYRRIRPSRTQGDDVGFGLERQGRAPLSGSRWRYCRAEERSAQSGDKLASVQPENAICHGVDADHFPLDMSS
jgi:hypothetical protein